MSTESLWIQNLHAQYAHLPMAPERHEFLQHKLEEGSSWSTLRQTAIYMAAAVSRMELTSESRPTPEAIDIAAASWATRRPPASRLSNPDQVRKRFWFIVTSWFRFLERLNENVCADDQNHELYSAFARYQRDERGLSEPTITKQCEVAKRFLSSYPLATIETHRNAVKAYLGHVRQLRKQGFTRSGISSHVYALKAFIRYAEQQHLVQPGFADFMAPPRIYRDERLCAGPSWPQVQRVLKDADTEKGTDIRDRAILLLLATYGLRASEAARLKLGDIDWERKQLLVTRSKTHKRAVFPLSAPVGTAIRKYIDHVRPTCKHDGLFVRRDAPLSILKPSSLGSMVARRLKDSGIKLQGSGAHSLRHACAARLLAEGLSLKAIGDQLGHVSADATRIYAKVDIVTLRRVADFDFGGLL